MIHQIHENKFSDIIIKKIEEEYIIKQNQKKNILMGGNPLYNIIKTIEDTIAWFYNSFLWLFSPIFTLIDKFMKWFFKPDGSMPCTWSHLYFLAFIFAILLFVLENILIIIVRGSTDIVLKRINAPSFNLNHWISFVQLNFVLLYYTLIYKFSRGYLDKGYYLILSIILVILLQKGLVLQTISYLSGIKINL